MLLSFYRPGGKKLRSKNEVISYIADNSLKVDIALFDFNKSSDDSSQSSNHRAKNSTPAGNKVASKVATAKAMASAKSVTPKPSTPANSKKTSATSGGRKKKTGNMGKRSAEPAKKFKVRMKFPINRKRSRMESEQKEDEKVNKVEKDIGDKEEEDVENKEEENKEADDIEGDDDGEVLVTKKAKTAIKTVPETLILGARKRKHTMKARPSSPIVPAIKTKKPSPLKKKKSTSSPSKSTTRKSIGSSTKNNAANNKKKRGRPTSKTVAGMDHSSNELTASERQLNIDIASIDADILAMKETPPVSTTNKTMSSRSAHEVRETACDNGNDEHEEKDDTVHRMDLQQDVIHNEVDNKTKKLVDEIAGENETSSNIVPPAAAAVESSSAPTEQSSITQMFSAETQKVLDEIVSTPADDMSITTPADIASSGSRRQRKKPSWLSDAQYETGDPLAKIKESARQPPPQSKSPRAISPTKMPTYNDLSLLDLQNRISTHTSPTKSPNKPPKTPKIPKNPKLKAIGDILTPLGMSPAKRGRGRPRKSVVPTVLSSVNERIDSEYSNINNFKVLH